MNTSVLKRWPGWVLMLGAVVAVMMVASLRSQGVRSESDRIDSITKRIACPVCSGESVFESRNAASVNIHNKVEDLVRAGTLSDSEIIASVQKDSGVQLLLVPRRSGFEALAWALPVAVAVMAVVGLGLAFRSWKRAADAVHTGEDRALGEAARRTEESSTQ